MFTSVVGSLRTVGTVLGHLLGRVQCNYMVAVYVVVISLGLVLDSCHRGYVVTLVTDCNSVFGLWNVDRVPHFMDGIADLWRRIQGMRARVVQRLQVVTLRWVRSHR